MPNLNKTLFTTLCVALISSCTNAAQVQDEDTQAKANAAPLQNDKSLLDVLSDYDRDLWSGPEGWSDEQWQWKSTLKWDQHCDYVGTVETYNLSKTIQLITIECVPGAYQPMHYLYLYDMKSTKSKPLLLGAPESTDNPKEIWGNVEVNRATNEVSIISLSRGVGDCGIYRLFKLTPAIHFEQANLTTIETRKQTCMEQLPEDFSTLPESIFDYKQWPKFKN